MAPSPENDNTPKAPDKGDKPKCETGAAPPVELEVEVVSATDNKEASVSRLDDVELKALLDEAMNYKIPKDRVGKSKLFQNLLEKAEEDDRKARATSASGSESVRYYNTTASHRNRRRRETNSVSENLTHGGSLNNLAKEELYAAATHLNRPPKTVSARQRQGGSLPCNVNAGVALSYDKQFFDEAARRNKKKPIENLETDSLLEYDALDCDYEEQPEIEAVQTRIPRVPVKYTSKFNIEIGGGETNPAATTTFPSYPALVFLGGNNVSGVDEAVTVSALERSGDKFEGYSIKPVEVIATSGHYQGSSHYNPYMPSWPFTKKCIEDRRVDENGNALGQSSGMDTKKSKKKKIQTDKNVVVVEASNVAGHRSDIINDLDKLVEFIGGKDESSKPKSVHTKAKIKHHQFTNNSAEDKSKKQKARCKPKGEKLHKSNSLDEISVSKLDDFSLEADGGKVVLRGTKGGADRPRERRSWGNSESLPLHASAENLETADFRVVTKKKKSKKSRGSHHQRQPLTGADFNHVASSPEPRRKSASSVPHSDKSNDSSDVDSVHSLPVERTSGEDSLDVPASYADITKTSGGALENRPKWNRLPSERQRQTDSDWNSEGVKTKSVDTQTSETNVSDIQNWPAINNQEKVGVRNGKGMKHIEHVPLPPNIPDVQTIEQLQLKQAMQEARYAHQPMDYNNYMRYVQEVAPHPLECDSDRTSRPAVVILSGSGSKEVPGLTFGFEINEQLLSDDVCDIFTSRFFVPDVFHKHNHDKIVNFVGLAWEDTISQGNGRVKYYNDNL